MIRHPVEPTGWPRPTPEPLTLTRSRGSSPSSRSQPRYWAAKASFTSISSKSARLRPDPGQEVPDGRDGAQPHDGGMAAAAPDRLDPGEGCEPEFPCLFGGHDDHGARPVVHAGGVSRRDLAGLRDEGGGQCGEVGHREPRPEMFVLVEDDGRLSLLLGDLHGDDLFPEVAFPGGPLGVVVAAEGHRVDLLPGEVVHLGDQFGRDPHDVGLSAEELDDAALLDRPLLQAGEEVRARMEAVDDVIHEDLVLETASPAGGGDGIGDPRHVLHAAGEDDVRHAGLDHRHARRRRPPSRRCRPG